MAWATSTGMTWERQKGGSRGAGLGKRVGIRRGESPRGIAGKKERKKISRRDRIWRICCRCEKNTAGGNTKNGKKEGALRVSATGGAGR